MPKRFQNKSKCELIVNVQDELCSVEVGEESREKYVDSSCMNLYSDFTNRDRSKYKK